MRDRRYAARAVRRVQIHFARDDVHFSNLTDPDDIEAEIRALSRAVAGQLQRESLLCRVVRIKIRYPDFHTVTRQLRLGVGTDAAQLIETFAVHLLRERVPLDERGVRLIGGRRRRPLGDLGEAAAAVRSRDGSRVRTSGTPTG